ncbi:MAG: hypothetical protein M1840_008304 [Geoglossum simile]|nr:MAG: hypothetical protein M1840_008304 [Geoglossum simile]
MASASVETPDGSQYTVPLWIAGEEIRTGTSFDVINPVTQKVTWVSCGAKKAEATQAVEAAHAAFPSWSRTKPHQRRDIITRVADLLEKRAEEVGGYLQNETGAGDFWLNFNVSLSSEMLRDVAGRISSIAGVIPTCAQEGMHALVYKEPYGVILGIAPWNAPFILGFRAVACALAAGNTVVLKASERSPRCFWAIGSIFNEAGLPPGALNVVAHRQEDAPEIVEAMVAHPMVKKINFTGSTSVGRTIAAAAGKHLKPVLMELGGKASSLVLEDADLELAAHWNAVGAFLHSGQICMSTERIVVHQRIAGQFITLLKAAIEEIHGQSSGPAPTVVAIANLQKTKSLVDSALASGATLLTGSAEFETPTSMRPVVVQNVTREMDLYYTESFGPSVSLIVVKSEEEAVEVANDTEYGLTAAVFTRDLATGLRVARQIESG